MKFIEEFKQFALKGNVVDLAVGVVIGVAFQAIVNSFVNDILMPPLGLLTGKTEGLKKAFVVLRGGTYDSLAAAREAGAIVIAYGEFLNTIIEFIIIALAVFVLVKLLSKASRKEKKKNAKKQPTEDIVLLREIRDQLVAKKSK